MSLGERIKSARVSAGMSLRELGEKVGLSHAAIAKYEKDEVIPNSQVIIQFADALNVRIDYFFRDQTVTLSNPQYRKKSSLREKAKKAILSEVVEWLERYLDVEMILGIRRNPDSILQEKIAVNNIEEAEDAADQLRERWKLGNDPIENLMDVLEQNGIKVGLIDDYPKFDALIVTFNERYPAIIIKKGIPGDRQRFNLAHELAHLVLDVQGELDEEKVAHRFAGAFLVPRTAAYQELGRNRNNLIVEELLTLKLKYGMSMQAWIYRAADLGIISRQTAGRLYRQFKMRGWYRHEPGPQVAPEEPTHMKMLVFRALGEEVITPSRAAELLGGDQRLLAIPENGG